jgi:diketogulonate reductase-like aldo/keto reductase
MPQLCFGTAQVNLRGTLAKALEIGYRHIDGAEAYAQRERGYYSVIKDCISTVKREDLWITWKGHNLTIASIRETIRKLGCEYLDLYLVHDWNGNYSDIDILKLAQAEGLIHHYGVSNCETIEDIHKLTSEPYKMYAVQNQARPPGGQIAGRGSMSPTFVDECNTLGVNVMLFATVSGYINQDTDFQLIEDIPLINKYYLQKFILEKPNVLMVSSTNPDSNSLQSNFDDFQKVIAGEPLLTDDRMAFVEEILKSTLLNYM